MGTCRASGWGFRAFVNIAAIQAPPFHRLITLEHPTALDAFKQAAKSTFVLLLGHRNHVEDHADGLETFLASLSGEGGIQSGPLFVLAVGCGREVFERRADDAGRETALDP